MEIKVVSPAKINLGLEIISKRSDGYHDVDMIMQSINLFDEITVTQNNTKKIFVKSNKLIDCNLNQNIAYKCADLFFKTSKIKNEGILIYINKQIPMCAGLAGGSSNGAATLLALNKIYGNFFQKEKLIQIASLVGADIPFCILGGTARASGFGEILKKIPSKNNYFLVVVKPEFSISTQKAYSLFEKLENKNIKNFNNIEVALNEGNVKKISSLIFNRFESLIKNPQVYKIKEKLCNFGALSALMTGSGSAIYGIFENEKLAKNCFLEIKKIFKESFLCKPIDFGAKII